MNAATARCGKRRVVVAESVMTKDMCVRKENEAWIMWAFRQLCEKPGAVLSVLCVVAVCILYMDLRGLFQEQTEAYRAVAEKLSEMNVRISELEYKVGRGER